MISGRTAGTTIGSCLPGQPAMLAVAAQRFDSPSETFIRNHVRMIAPGATILICLDDQGADQFGVPVLSNIELFRPPASSVWQRVANIIRNRWRTYVFPGLGAEDRRRVRDFLDAHKPKAVLAEYGPTGWLLGSVCHEARIPLFVHFHGYDAHISPERRLVRKRYRQLFSIAHGVIVTTEFMKSRLLSLGCPEGKLIICPCGVDTDAFTPSEHQSAKRIVMVSRLMPQKGPLQSVRSFAALLASHPDAGLEIIGDGPLRGETEAEVKRLGLTGRVTFLGAHTHDFVRSRLQAARLFIQHCVTVPGGGTESLGLSILEAMACGLPVVSTRHGAIVETVRHGVTGLLVDEHDVDGMAAAMAKLLDDPELAAEMGAAGRQRVLENYSLAQATDRLRAILGLTGVEARVDRA